MLVYSVKISNKYTTHLLQLMSNQQAQILIHIGYPKTASSWLQSTIFAKESTGFCVPWKNIVREGMSKGLSRDAVTQFVETNNFDLEATQQVFYPYLETASKKDLIPVISNEFLSGGFAVYPKNYYQGLEKDIVKRLYQTFPQANILMVIREQKSIIISAYKEYIKRGGKLKFKRFLSEIIRPENLKFDELITEYQTTFGQDKILVLPFEMLKGNQEKFCQSIFSFVGLPYKDCTSTVEKNIGFTGSQVSAQRLVNFFFPSQGNFGYKLSSLAYKITPKNISDNLEQELKQVTREYVGNKFTESNQKTSEIIGINLREFKYT